MGWRTKSSNNTTAESPFPQQAHPVVQESEGHCFGVKLDYFFISCRAAMYTPVRGDYCALTPEYSFRLWCTASFLAVCFAAMGLPLLLELFLAITPVTPLIILPDRSDGGYQLLFPNSFHILPLCYDYSCFSHRVYSFRVRESEGHCFGIKLQIQMLP